MLENERSQGKLKEPGMRTDSEVDRLLDAAEELFYGQGYQSVGMDAIREASGLPLKRIYALYAGKDALAVAMLDRRDERWRGELAAHVEREAQPEARVQAIFDWLTAWLAGEGYRGCAWINAFGELGATTPGVAAAVREHKTKLREYVTGVVISAGGSRPIADGVFLLVEGALVTAGIDASPEPAVQAGAVAASLLGTDRAARA